MQQARSQSSAKRPTFYGTYVKVADEPYCLFHSANFLHGLIAGTWYPLPMKGRPFGPGGILLRLEFQPTKAYSEYESKIMRGRCHDSASAAGICNSRTSDGCIVTNLPKLEAIQRARVASEALRTSEWEKEYALCEH